MIFAQRRWIKLTMVCPICIQPATKRHEEQYTCEFGHVWVMDDQRQPIVLQDQPSSFPEPELKRKRPHRRIEN